MNNNNIELIKQVELEYSINTWYNMIIITHGNQYNLYIIEEGLYKDV